MRPDKYKRRQQAPRAEGRLRQQIAREAARRMYSLIGPEEDAGPLRDAEASDYYLAKRKAAAVLGHRVRPGDLPTDHEVREEVLALARDWGGPGEPAGPEPGPEAEAAGVPRLAEHLERFALYKLRLAPLESVKQPAKSHPEGDALFHSLQVFELAPLERPYDEEFLLAALLHDVGKAIDPSDPVPAALAALEGAIPACTAWLITHQKEDAPREGARPRPDSADDEDLALLRQLDAAGRVPGAPVSTLDEALRYLKGLEEEAYLEE